MANLRQNCPFPAWFGFRDSGEGTVEYRKAGIPSPAPRVAAWEGTLPWLLQDSMSIGA